MSYPFSSRPPQIRSRTHSEIHFYTLGGSPNIEEATTYALSAQQLEGRAICLCGGRIVGMKNTLREEPMPSSKSRASVSITNSGNGKAAKAEAGNQRPASAASGSVKEDVDMINVTNDISKRPLPAVPNGAAANSAATMIVPENATAEAEQNVQAMAKRIDVLERALQDVTEAADKWQSRAREGQERYERAEANLDRSHRGSSFAAMQRDLNDAKRDIEILQRQKAQIIKEANEQIALRDERLNKATHEARNSIQSLTIEHSKKETERDSQIKQLLDKVTRDKVEGKWNPPPDSDIQHKFNNLNNDIRDWAKAHANKSLNLGAMMNKEFARFLSDFVFVQNNGGAPALLCQNSAKWREKLGPLLLHAALSDAVHTKIFGNPLFVVGVEEHQVLKDVFHAMKKSDQKEAHIWRATMWRLLAPPTHLATAEAARVAEETKRIIRDYCADIDKQFRESQAQHLLAQAPTKEVQERASKLRRILEAAAELARTLFTQHAYLQIIDLQFLREQKIAFHRQNPYLEGHPLSRVDVDDDSHNGEGIIVVTRPAVLAFDEDDTSGIAGDNYRVLEKATVLLEGKK